MNNVSFIKTNDKAQEIENKYYFSTVSLLSTKRIEENIFHIIQKNIIKFMSGSNFLLVSINCHVINFSHIISFILTTNNELQSTQQKNYYIGSEKLDETFHPLNNITIISTFNSYFGIIELTDDNEIIELSKIIYQIKNKSKNIITNNNNFDEILKFITNNCSIIIFLQSSDENYCKLFCNKSKTSFVQEINDKNKSEFEVEPFYENCYNEEKCKKILKLMKKCQNDKIQKLKKNSQIKELKLKINELKNINKNIKMEIEEMKQKIDNIEYENRKIEEENKCLRNRNCELYKNFDKILNDTEELKIREIDEINQMNKKFERFIAENGKKLSKCIKKKENVNLSNLKFM